jgi:hypothetical protein
MRTYKELIEFKTFKERFDYLKLNGMVGNDTFGFDRWLNQRFYKSAEWKHIRNFVILRDNGCDLGLAGNDISGKILIHHMNPISIDDIENRSDILLNPDYLICVSHNTHNAIHYGDSDLLLKVPLQRTKNDTCPWKY